jgi:DNA processing protein
VAVPDGAVVIAPWRPDVRHARAWLSRAVEPGNAEVYRFVSRYGPVDAVRRMRAGNAPDSVLRLAAARSGQDRSAHDLAEAARLSIRLVTPEDDEWPDDALSSLADATAAGVDNVAPPLALWVRGVRRLDHALARAVAIVGTRAATPYGSRVAADLAHDVTSREWTVVSGGAYGIDGAGHRGALAAGGPTVAVIAGGLRAPYPAGHAALFDRIADSGLLISEWPPDCPPHRYRFLVRNRLIAAVAAGTVVVEASARSGATSTALHAERLGKPVMAVPGPVTSVLSIGTHNLIREHQATLVTRASEVLELIGPMGESLAEPPRSERRPRDGLSPVAQRVLDGMPARAPVSPDAIAVESGIPVVDVLRCLPALELDGFVEATSAGWRLRASARR